MNAIKHGIFHFHFTFQDTELVDLRETIDFLKKKNSEAQAVIQGALNGTDITPKGEQQTSLCGPEWWIEATEMKILDPFKDMGKEVRDCFLLGAERELSLIAAICIALFYWSFEVQRETVVCAVWRSTVHAKPSLFFSESEL